MKDALDIAEVVKRSGLTSRTLRFYESRGLVAPLRTNGGRRLYGPAELERIKRIVALKQAGLTLAQIERAMAERQTDLVELVDEQLKALEQQKRKIEQGRSVLIQTVIHLEPGKTADVQTLCSLVRQALNRNALSADRASQLFEGLDLDELKRRWSDLAVKIEAAMPVDPASAEAQLLFD